MGYLYQSAELTFRSDDEEDETAELLRELEKIKKERAEQREREVLEPCCSAFVTSAKCEHQEREKEAEEQEKREHDIALGNPLLNPTKDFSVRRRYLKMPDFTTVLYN